MCEGPPDHPGESGSYESQPYLVSLLTLSTGTRLFETLLLHSPRAVFNKIWSTYFEGKIGKLAIHPMSNFVVAKAIERLDEQGIERVVMECKAVSGGRGMISKFVFPRSLLSRPGLLLVVGGGTDIMIENARTSVLQALVERSRKLDVAQQTVLGVSSPFRRRLRKELLTLSLSARRCIYLKIKIYP